MLGPSQALRLHPQHETIEGIGRFAELVSVYPSGTKPRHSDPGQGRERRSPEEQHRDTHAVVESRETWCYWWYRRHTTGTNEHQPRGQDEPALVRVRVVGCRPLLVA